MREYLEEDRGLINRAIEVDADGRRRDRVQAIEIAHALDAGVTPAQLPVALGRLSDETVPSLWRSERWAFH